MMIQNLHSGTKFRAGYATDVKDTLDKETALLIFLKNSTIPKQTKEWTRNADYTLILNP